MLNFPDTLVLCYSCTALVHLYSTQSCKYLMKPERIGCAHSPMLIASSPLQQQRSAYGQYTRDPLPFNLPPSLTHPPTSIPCTAPFTSPPQLPPPHIESSRRTVRFVEHGLSISHFGFGSMNRVLPQKRRIKEKTKRRKEKKKRKEEKKKKRRKEKEEKRRRKERVGKSGGWK